MKMVRYLDRKHSTTDVFCQGGRNWPQNKTDDTERWETNEDLYGMGKQLNQTNPEIWQDFSLSNYSSQSSSLLKPVYILCYLLSQIYIYIYNMWL
jgi:hypothetical protein